MELNTYQECMKALTDVSSVIFGLTDEGEPFVMTCKDGLVHKCIDQNNGWVRDEWLHEDGTVELLYSR